MAAKAPTRSGEWNRLISAVATQKRSSFWICSECFFAFATSPGVPVVGSPSQAFAASALLR